MSTEAAFAYDKILYPNYLHNQTHPDRLATMAKFYGMNPPPIENCRVLELGCGTGSSLMSFAYDLKDSQFVGVDLSEKQIAYGQEAIKAIAIENMELLRGDITKLSKEQLGEFDYIIAHGVYSWVPDFVRDRILALCRELLKENGIAYISYNALPGCHFRQIVREMMMYHTKHIDAPTEKVNNSLGLLKFVSETASKENYKKVIQDEFKELTDRNFENIYHDDLSEINDPVYFHQFIEHAEKHDLQFLSEVEYPSSFTKKMPGGDVIKEITNNRIEQEQYVDFLEGRKFRQTLLCRKEVRLSSGYDKQIIRDLYLASPLAPETDNLEIATDKREIFRGQKKEKIEIDHPLTKALLAYLSEIWAESVHFSDAVKIAAQRISDASGKDYTPAEDDLEIVVNIIFTLFCTGQFRLENHKMRFMPTISERPTANRIARWDAARAGLITTLLSTGVNINDPLGRKLIQLMDGTRNQQQLEEALTNFIKSEEYDSSADVKEKLLETLPFQLKNNLQRLAGLAILEA